MKKKTVLKAVSITMGAVLTCGTFGFLSGCFQPKKADTLVMMTEELNGLFNPFFYTAGPDGGIVGQTQMSMLSTDADGNLNYGDNEPVVVKDYDYKRNSDNTTTYTYVIKNGIKFSDGTPLTMNDVMFNLYVYLDPAYTGSTTMYSTDIVGLQRYRTQKNVSGDGSAEDDKLNDAANARAGDRVNELVNLFHTAGQTSTAGSYEADETKMREAISKHTPSDGYKKSIAVNGEIDNAKAREQLLADYNDTLKTFKEELQNDYNGAKESYKEEPYKSTGEFDEITSFMYAEGYVTLEYGKDGSGKPDYNNIIKVNRGYSTSVVNSEAKAVAYVYDDKVMSSFDQILTYWGTAATMSNEFVAKAKEVILHETVGEGELLYPNISGIKSLAHQNETKGTKVVLHEGQSNQAEYTVASSHNENGVVSESNAYDVLTITVNEFDPKAEWNFGFTVAPYHYYSNPSKYAMNIEENKFGVEWGSFEFMKNTVQGEITRGGVTVSKNRVPMGAGPYIATDNGFSTTTPANNGFLSNKVVYFKANDNFVLGAPKIKKLCYQTISSNNALGMLESGSVHYVEPQFTKQNSEKLKAMESKGYKQLDSWQLGYGYIGINAGKIPNIAVRRCIMAAMDISLATTFYSDGTAVNINWPMSVVGWAYPRAEGYDYDPSNPTANMERDNGHAYTRWTGEDNAKKYISETMASNGLKPGDSELTVKFTIAGSDVSEHPTFKTFNKAKEILNDLGWKVEVSPDLNALVKLSTGSLAVWAAAWSSAIDPDMYQIYHKNSSASSVLAWGYRDILTNKTQYPTENRILTELSSLIDEGRTTDDKSYRAETYKQAMGKVLDLAIELPVYQRKVLYAYNANVIKASSVPSVVNPYTSPFERIWEIELVD